MEDPDQRTAEATRDCLCPRTCPVRGALVTLPEPAILPCSLWVSATFKGGLLQPFMSAVCGQMRPGISVKKCWWGHSKASLPGQMSEGSRGCSCSTAVRHLSSCDPHGPPASLLNLLPHAHSGLVLEYQPRYHTALAPREQLLQSKHNIHIATVTYLSLKPFRAVKLCTTHLLSSASHCSGKLKLR